MTETWKDTARICCGQPAFPSDTRFGTRHSCRICGSYAWGDGPFGTEQQHATRRLANKIREQKGVVPKLRRKKR